MVKFPNHRHELSFLKVWGCEDEVTIRVGNGSKVDVIAVGTLPLHLPSGLVLDLNNCYLVPALSMNRTHILIAKIYKSSETKHYVHAPRGIDW